MRWLKKGLEMSEKALLFKQLRDRGIFWSYLGDISYEEAGDVLFLEYLLKYGDFDELKQAFKLFDKVFIYSVWEQKMRDDKRFIKLNLMLARVFFGMNVESDYFKEVKSARFEKLKMLAS